MCRNGSWVGGGGEPSFVSMNHFVYADIIRLDFGLKELLAPNV